MSAAPDTLAPPAALPLGDPVALTEALMRIGSVSGDEERIADAVEAALRPAAHLEVVRDGNCVLARTRLGRAERVLLAGHLDTVPHPVSGRVVPHVTGGVLHGRGSVDMLGGCAVLLDLAVALDAPVRDVTWVFYDNEEVTQDRNGLTRLTRTHRDWLAADLAVLAEPTGGAVEGGCQGTTTLRVAVRGRAGHSARAWLADNAVHTAAAAVARVAAHEQRRPVVDGLEFREGMQVVRIDGGFPTYNVVPDAVTFVVNHRYAPDRRAGEAQAAVRTVVDPQGDARFSFEVLDAADGARPGLDAAPAAALAAAVTSATGRGPRAKFGWTDVARFAALGIPAVNYGPGDPGLAHTDDERVPVAEITQAAAVLRAWLTGAAGPAPVAAAGPA